MVGTSVGVKRFTGIKADFSCESNEKHRLARKLLSRAFVLSAGKYQPRGDRFVPLEIVIPNSRGEDRLATDQRLLSRRAKA